MNPLLLSLVATLLTQLAAINMELLAGEIDEAEAFKRMEIITNGIGPALATARSAAS